MKNLRSVIVILALLFVPFNRAEKERQITVNGPEGPEHDAAVAARFVINNVDWAAIGTISTNDEVSGYPMTNILGMTDGPIDAGEGIPYILMSHQITGKDITENRNIALSISLAQIEYCQYNHLDEQDPRCTRVNFIGTYKNLSTDHPKYTYAKDSLKTRHPQIKNWDDFYLGKLELQFIAVLNWFGGAKIVSVTDYLNIKPYQYLDRYYIANLKNRTHRETSMGELTEFCPEKSMKQISEVISNFIIHNAGWGMVTTLSYNNEDNNVTDGTPFNSVVSIADGFVNSGSGIPYIYVTPLENLVKNILHDNKISMLLSLARTKFCKGLDAISDLCPAVILTGSLFEIDIDSTEYQYAQMALFSRHASMARLPKDHSFKVNMMDIAYVQLRYKFCNDIGYFLTEWKSITSNQT